MLYPLSILSLVLLFLIHLGHGSSHQKHSHGSQHLLSPETDSISFETRAYWMRKANAALTELASPCPFAAFGTVIVNHTATSEELPHGKLVCYSVNQNQQEGNPTLHGTSPQRLSRKFEVTSTQSRTASSENETNTNHRRNLRNKQLLKNPHLELRAIRPHPSRSPNSLPLSNSLHKRRTMSHGTSSTPPFSPSPLNPSYQAVH